MNLDSLLEVLANLGSFNQFSGLRRAAESTPELQLFGSGDQFRFGIGRRQHEIGNSRHDFRTEPRTVEHTVMTDALLHVMHATMIRNRRAQRVCRLGLSKTRDVVLLAFDRHQRHAADF